MSAKRKRGYITTTINHVFKCHLQHFAKRKINTSVNLLQTSEKRLTKRSYPVIIITATDTIYISFFTRLKLWGAFTWVQKNQKILGLSCTRVMSIT